MRPEVLGPALIGALTVGAIICNDAYPLDSNEGNTSPPGSSVYTSTIEKQLYDDAPHALAVSSNTCRERRTRRSFRSRGKSR